MKTVDIKAFLNAVAPMAGEHGIDIPRLSKALDTQFDAKHEGIKKASFKKLSLDDGIFSDLAKQGKTLTQYLEEQDPSDNYYDSTVPKHLRLDAFERQLAAYGLNVGGRNAIALSEWWNQPESRVLFPEFISRQIELGRLLGRFTLRAEDVIVTSLDIDSGVYEAAQADMTGDFHQKRVTEGGEFPKLTITHIGKSITLKKYAFELDATYEYLRRVRANIFSVFLRLIGWTMELDKAEDCVDIIVNGNPGLSNPAGTFSASTVTMDNFIDFWVEFTGPYQSNFWIAPKAGFASILKISEIKNNDILMAAFMQSGEPLRPFNIGLKRHDPGTSILTSKILGLDTNFTVAEVNERGSIIEEADKLITSQWGRMTFSEVTGYYKIIADAAKVWDYS